MSQLKLSGGDLDITGGRLSEVSGLDEIRQHLETRLKTWRGERFYDATGGVDYGDVVFPAEDRDAVLGELRREALGIPGVTDATLIITSDEPARLEVRGTFIASLSELDDLIRAEFGPIEIGQEA